MFSLVYFIIILLYSVAFVYENDVERRKRIGISGIILAGGKSSRLGRDKALLPIDGRPFLEKIAQEVATVVDEIIVVTNRHTSYPLPNIRETHDILPNKGPLGGIHAGLCTCSYEYAFVTACDLPNFNPQLAAFLLERRHGYDVVVPQIGSFTEPLFAVYRKTTLPYIAKQLTAGFCKVTGFYSQVRVAYITEAEILRSFSPAEVFFNVNTQEDYDYLLRKKRSYPQK